MYVFSKMYILNILQYSLYFIVIIKNRYTFQNVYSAYFQCIYMIHLNGFTLKVMFILETVI